jgi:radical SAM superfamily enzyme YgiQ (UPF0313 family)
MSWQDKERYARLRSGERPVAGREFGRALARAVLVYPNDYHVGMSNLGFQTIYRIVNSIRGFLCDRFFPLDWPSPEPPVSLECERPLSDFDVLAFSVAFENDYLNVLKTLDMARIPLRASRRDDSTPLVVIGGAVTYINPEPIADFADIIVMGEGERTAPELFDLLVRARGSRRDSLLVAAAGIDGVYVPALRHDGPPVARVAGVAGGKRIAKSDISHSAVIAKDTEFGDTFLVEISRGCPYRCRFCAVGNGYPHFRSAEADDVLDLVKRRLLSGDLEPPVRRVGLVSSAVGDHPDLDRIVAGLSAMGLEIGVSSLRVDRLSDYMLRCLAGGGTRTMTIAPEAGSERLRVVAGKHISDNTIIEGAVRAIENGVPNVRLYFMVGLPTESDDDIVKLMELAVKVRKAMDGGMYALTWAKTKRAGSPRGGVDLLNPRAYGTVKSERPAGTLTVSLAPFVPKPGTPFQWSAMADFGEMKRKIAMIRRGLGGERRIKVKSEGLKSAYLQGLLSRGGRDASLLLEEIYRARGDWRAAAAKMGLSTREVLGHREIDAASPWDSMLGWKKHVELVKAYRRAMSWVEQ